MKVALVLLLSSFLISPQVFAGNVICVMKMNIGGSNPCSMNLPQFGEVVERDTNQFICVRKYEDNYCKYNKNEFYHALGRNGASVCVMNFKQELTGNPCSRNTDQYAYLVEPW